MTLKPRVTFGIIVLNGSPFTKYTLRALYPFAHQIIVVEGACPSALGIATEDGHSIDDTLAVLKRFKAEEDIENKVTIVTAENEGYPSGFWPGEKTEQSRAYSKRATGDWLWQVDIDEFYQPEDMDWICSEILLKSKVETVSFEQIQFWGGLNWFVDGWYLKYHGGNEFHRIFRWEPGYTYIDHRPPTVLNREGVNERNINWLRGTSLSNKGIYLYHYSFLFPKQVQAKSNYYSKVSWGAFDQMINWAETSYLTLKHPFNVHNVYKYPSWLECYKGNHPPQVNAMWSDIQSGCIRCDLRRTDDIRELMKAPWYMIGRSILKGAGPVVNDMETFGKRAFLLFPKDIQRYIKGALRIGLRSRSK
jgi:hypothetical protein